MNTIKRYQNLYDEAAKKYAEACKAENQKVKRICLRSWKQRMKWLDQMLSDVESHFTTEEA